MVNAAALAAENVGQVNRSYVSDGSRLAQAKRSICSREKKESGRGTERVRVWGMPRTFPASNPL
jgi:hypothetical protein